MSGRFRSLSRPRLTPRPTALAAAGALLALTFLAACSQNEYSQKGAAPPAPVNPREAHVVDRSGTSGMNEVAAPADEGAPAQGEAQGGGSFTGTVVLPDALKKHFKPGETLFVIVRSPDGSPTPVAAVKMVVQSFPVPFEITAKDAMMGAALPATADLLLRLDADGDLSTQGPDDLVGGPTRARISQPVTLQLQEPAK